MAEKLIRVVYKVYQPNGTFVGQLNDVISTLNFTSYINGGLGELVVRLPRPISDYDQGTIITLNNILKVYVTDEYNDNTLVYSGYITAYNPFFDGQHEGVEFTCLGLVGKLKNDFYRSGDTLQIAHSAQDCSVVIKAIVDNYRASISNPQINYNVGSTTVDTTGNTITYTYTKKKHLDAILKTAEFFPYNWYWVLRADGNVYVKQYSTTADHLFKIGSDIKEMTVHNNMETVVNRFYFDNGLDSNDPSYISSVYSDGTSQGTYDIIADQNTDGRVTIQATADNKGNRVINANKDPKLNATLFVKNTYDIWSIHPGQTCNIRNISNDDQTTFSTDLLIVQVTYSQDGATLELAEKRLNFTNDLQTNQVSIGSRVTDLESLITNIPTTNISIAGQKFSYTGAFSSTDNDTAAWASGTLNLSDGTSRAINAGNTGNMLAATVIYYDDDVSQTVFQTSTTFSAAIGKNKLPIALAIPTADTGENCSIVLYQTGTGFLWNENNIGQHAVTFLKVDIAQLSAITADMGTITAGAITAGTATIGNFAIGSSTISATNLTMTSGAANTANITVGTGANAGGLNSANASGDIVIWAGSTFANRATAVFRVTAAGAITSTSGTIGGWTLASTSFSSGSVTISTAAVSAAAGTIKIDASATIIYVGSALTIDGAGTGTVTAGTVRTSSSNPKVQLSGANNRVEIINSAGSTIAFFGSAGANGNIINVNQTDTNEDYPPVYITSAQDSNVISAFNTNSSLASRPAFRFESNNASSEAMYVKETGAYIAGFFESNSTTAATATMYLKNTGAGGYSLNCDSHVIFNNDKNIYVRFTNTYMHVNASGYLMWNDSALDGYVVCSDASTSAAAAAAGAVAVKINGTTYNLLYK